MVDVGGKPVTARAAAAECRLEASARLLELLRAGALAKGDALAVARVAGVMAAKRTASLIPLCHQLPLECARVSLVLERSAVLVRCEVAARARTGAEMEALAGCAGAALTLYDMGKAVDKDMRITDLRVVSKTGGKSDYPPPAPAPPPPPEPPADAAEPARPADRPEETFAPINFANL
ncbi:cyclic pyranopterin monophosphate synthase-like [Choristoneura fumiferana]|uniref:cyclic pyranopterin monophosphate synthase-like n=1 Tax=Choristoneura fumiferana TaxID=7141 RepID=UPI003D156E58